MYKYFIKLGKILNSKRFLNIILLVKMFIFEKLPLNPIPVSTRIRRRVLNKFYTIDYILCFMVVDVSSKLNKPALSLLPPPSGITLRVCALATGLSEFKPIQEGKKQLIECVACNANGEYTERIKAITIGWKPTLYRVIEKRPEMEINY